MLFIDFCKKEVNLFMERISKLSDRLIQSILLLKSSKDMLTDKIFYIRGKTKTIKILINRKKHGMKLIPLILNKR
jgi:phage-related holin